MDTYIIYIYIGYIYGLLGYLMIDHDESCPSNIEYNPHEWTPNSWLDPLLNLKFGLGGL